MRRCRIVKDFGEPIHGEDGRVAAARFLSLIAWQDEVERNAKAILSLAAGELVNSMMVSAAGGELDDTASRDLLERTVQHGAMGSRHVLALTDEAFRIVAVTPESTGWQGKMLDAIMTGGQPLFMFRERAG